MDNKLLVDTAVLAGEIMLKNGAETFRVEDTINRILMTSNLKKTEAFVMQTGLIATLDDTTIDAITVIKRIPERGINLNKISIVNTISRQYCDGLITLEEAFQKLNRIEDNQYSPIMHDLAIVTIVSSFVLVLGGKWGDALAAIMSGVLLALLMRITNQLKMNSFLRDLILAAGSCIGTILFIRILPYYVNTDLVIIGTIMPLVPGVAITNAIRDTFQGDYISGCAKILEAFVKAISIVIGVGVGIAAMGGI